MSRLDPITGHIWHYYSHIEICRRQVSEDAFIIVKDVLEGKAYSMPEKLVLESERAIQLINGEPDDEFEYVDSEFAGQWRWGVSYQVVIREKSRNMLWGVTYQEQIGDNYYNSLEDSNTVHFYPVEAVEVTSYEYKRIK